MNMKIAIFSVLFLAVASLGLALPQTISVHLPSANTATTGSFDLNPKLAETLSPLDLPTGASSPISSLSPQCQSAILSILVDPEFLKCVPVTALLPLLPIVSDPTILAKFIADPKKNYDLVEGPLITFSKGICAAPKCSKEGNDKAIAALSDGCKDDLGKKNPIAVAIFDVTVFYSPLRDTLCFVDKKASKFCWDQSLLTAFSLPPSPIKIIDGGLADSVAVADPSAVCTDCNKDIVNTFGNFLKNNKLALQILASFGIDQKALEQLTTFIAVKCGINFIDGKIPG